MREMDEYLINIAEANQYIQDNPNVRQITVKGRRGQKAIVISPFIHVNAVVEEARIGLLNRLWNFMLRGIAHRG